jgi:hypothetical protein
MTSTPQEPIANTRELVNSIAEQLGEKQGGPIGQIRRLVERLGAASALALLEETKQIETAGGMMLPDGSRRRTPGGVYFHLIKGRISDEDRTFIFPIPNWMNRKQGKSNASTSQPIPTSIDPSELPNLNGEVAVKITLIGRPGATKVMKDGYVMTSMQNTKAPSFPKGLPAPPTAPTTYTVYIAPKQWSKVVEALKDPEDALIVEGWPTYDPMLEGIAVYVTNTTTKVLQRAQREG